MSFKSSLNTYENYFSYRSRVKNIIFYDYTDFSTKVINEDQLYTDSIVRLLMLSDFFILKNTYTKKFFKYIKQ